MVVALTNGGGSIPRTDCCKTCIRVDAGLRTCRSLGPAEQWMACIRGLATGERRRNPSASDPQHTRRYASRMQVARVRKVVRDLEENSGERCRIARPAWRSARAFFKKAHRMLIGDVIPMSAPGDWHGYTTREPIGVCAPIEIYTQVKAIAMRLCTT